MNLCFVGVQTLSNLKIPCLSNDKIKLTILSCLYSIFSYTKKANLLEDIHLIIVKITKYVPLQYSDVSKREGERGEREGE
jgi:hypothetical protein